MHLVSPDFQRYSVKKITVLLVDDQVIVRKGLRTLLDIEGLVDVVAEAENGLRAVQLARKHHPAVVLMDIAMPKLNGLEATRQILKSAPATRVLMLSAHDDDAYVDQAIALGASGYLLKHISAENLSTAIHEVDQGRTYFTPSISKRLGDRKSADHAAKLKKLKVPLSPRKGGTLKGIVKG